MKWSWQVSGRSLRSVPGILLVVCCLWGSSLTADEQRQSVTQEKIESFLRQYVTERAPWRPENVEFRVIAFPPVAVRSGQLGFRVLKSGLAPGMNSFLVAI